VKVITRWVLCAIGLAASACGVSEVKIDVRGGDGRLVRLEAERIQPLFNRLVEPGTFKFSEMNSGSYDVTVSAANWVETKTVEVGSPSISGVQTFELTFDIPPGSNPEFKPAGTILYSSTPTRVRDWDLFTVPAAGGQVTQLTDTRDFEQNPQWSPDGQRILYTIGDVMSNIDVALMDADGSNAIRLTQHRESDMEACWSPGGSRIAFVSQRDGDIAIWIMNVDGSEPRKLVQGRHPSWAPDGRTIAFTSGQFEGNDEIYVINTDGSDMRRLTTDKRFDWFPSWSPDGRWLAFNSERFGGQELMMANPANGDQIRITIAELTFELAPEWSPDGAGLVYQGKMKVGDDGELMVEEISIGKKRPMGTYDLFILPSVGFDWDDATAKPILPVNLTNTDDRDEVSPSWRAF
jgi:dipeptidyl aminopeptidase/acylaminoacyl peptidase